MRKLAAAVARVAARLHKQEVAGLEGLVLLAHEGPVPVGDSLSGKLSVRPIRCKVKISLAVNPVRLSHFHKRIREPRHFARVFAHVRINASGQDGKRGNILLEKLLVFCRELFPAHARFHHFLDYRIVKVGYVHRMPYAVSVAEKQALHRILCHISPVVADVRARVDGRPAGVEFHPLPICGAENLLSP